MKIYSSVLTGSLKVKGDIKAENYIVQTTVLALTQSFASGSTRFGNDQNDTHVFSGSLFISASRIGFDDGKNNFAIGKDAGKSITTGTKNVVIGSAAGDAMTDNTDNVVIGYNAFTSAEDGEIQNVIIGSYAGNNITSDAADKNVIIGYNS